MLAGLIAGQLAQPGQDPMAALAAGLALHGRAADALAAARGPHCVAISDLLDFFKALKMCVQIDSHILRLEN